MTTTGITVTTSTAPAAVVSAAAPLPAAVARMRLDPDRETSFADILGEVRLSDYWPLLADMLTFAIADIRTAHASECRRRGCRTCTAIADAAAWTAAHRQLATVTCTCHPDCTHRHGIPHPTRGFQP